MMCPHCTVNVRMKWQTLVIGRDAEKTPWGCQTANCHECDGLIIRIGRGQMSMADDGKTIRPVLRDFEPERTVWPHVAARTPLGDEIPSALKADYSEACEVLPISPKASAALSRRVLQALLQEQGYAGGNLARQVDAVLSEKDPSKVLPANIKANIDAIRNFGNFSAHPITDVTSLQVIEVDPEEAEWCLEIVERLFDHYYVRPAADAKKREDLNEKLQRARKPPAKA